PFGAILAANGSGAGTVALVRPRTARDPAGAGLSDRTAAALGADCDAEILREDGLRPLHASGNADAVHGVASDQDGAAVDAEPQVHRLHPGILLQHLNRNRSRGL